MGAILKLEPRVKWFLLYTNDLRYVSSSWVQEEFLWSVILCQVSNIQPRL